MGKYKNGHDLRLAFGVGSNIKYLAAAKDCSINGQANFEDVTTKDTPAGSTEEDFLNKTYEITANSLVVEAKDVAVWLSNVGTQVNFTYRDSSTGSLPSNLELCSGVANIVSVNHKATDGSKATLDISLKAVGEVGFNTDASDNVVG